MGLDRGHEAQGRQVPALRHQGHAGGARHAGAEARRACEEGWRQGAEGPPEAPDDQEGLAFPDINCKNPYIEKNIENIKGNALPNLMTLIPVRMINDEEKKITIYDIGECKEKRDQIKEKNRKTLPIIINIINMEKY